MIAREKAVEGEAAVERIACVAAGDPVVPEVTLAATFEASFNDEEEGPPSSPRRRLAGTLGRGARAGEAAPRLLLIDTSRLPVVPISEDPRRAPRVWFSVAVAGTGETDLGGVGREVASSPSFSRVPAGSRQK